MEKIELKNLDQSVYKETLENGLEVYMIPIENRNNYFVSYVAKYGSIHTEFLKDGKKYKVPNGIAHFLEHKMFEQEDGKTPFEFFAESGTDCNASTGYQTTKYYIYGTKDLNKNLDFLIRYVNDPYFTEENVEKEKGIIIEEVNMYQDDPSWKIFNTLYNATFYTHPLKYDIGGDEESVRSITKEQLYLCYEAFYHPKNMILMIAGNINMDEVLQVIKQNPYLNRDHGPFDAEKKIPKEKEQVKCNKKVVKENRLMLPKATMTLKIPLQSIKMDKVKIILYINLLLTILLGSASKKKEEWMRQDLMNALYYNKILLDDFIIIEFETESKNPEKLCDAILETLEHEPITEEEINRCKKVWIASDVRSTDNTESIASSVLDSILSYGKIINNKVDLYHSMNQKELEKLRKSIDFSNHAIVIGLPKK